MKLSFVSAEDPTAIGGTQKHVRRVAEELVNLGFQVEIVHPAPPTHALSRPIRLLSPAEFEYGRGYELGVRSIRRSIGRADAVIWNGTFFAALAAAARRTTGIKQYVVVHTADWSAGSTGCARQMKYMTYDLPLRSCGGSVDGLFAVSDDVARTIQGINRNVTIVYNGCDPPPEPTGDLAKTYDLMTISRLEPYKGLQSLISTIRASNLRLVVVGDGSYRRVLEDLASACERIVFTGRVDDRTLWSLLHSSRAFVLPSVTEGFGIVFLEAMSAGLPVVYPEHQSLSWMKGIGYPFRPQDAGSLLRSLEEAVSDTDSQRYKLFASKFTWQSVAERYASALCAGDRY